MSIPTTACGLVLHYFHGPSHPPAQGSLSADDFRRLLDAYGMRLHSPHAWIQRALAGILEGWEVTITFDDGLREALDIALPVLEERGLTACWNIYTQPLVGTPHSLERDRWLRNHAFGALDAFYARWDETVTKFFDRTGAKGYRADYGYLTEADRQYRYWRDCWATPSEYAEIMERLARQASQRFHPEGHWLSATDLRALRSAGHVIGLHTHSHPTRMDALTREQQELEYATSKYILEGILGEPVTTGASPCGVITEAGKEWLRINGVQLMWGATMKGTLPYETPRWSSGYFR